MTDVPVTDAPVADSIRDELVERLKRENAELMDRATRGEQRASIFEEKERTRIASYEGEAKFFMQDWMKAETENDPEARAEVAALGAWADEYTKKQDIVSQAPLARMSYVASKGIKRLREEASQLPEIKESLSKSMAALEEMTASRDKLQRENDDQRGLLDERQAALEKLNEKIVAAGMAAEKFNFAKATAREVAPPSEPAKVETAALEAGKVNASKSANPLEAQRDHLFDFINSSGGGGASLRMQPSQTQHAYLGRHGEVDVATALRSGGAMAL